MTTKTKYLTDEARLIAKKAAAGRKALTSELRGYSVDSAVKRAMAGPSQDSSFEQSFASLAYTYVQEKAPPLADFMIGFQLVDKNDDNTKAVGIFGFKIGDQWAYVPVFFINGNLKGHELLYLKNQDTFVPLKDGWVNHLLNKKPHILGEPSTTDQHQLGMQQPNFRPLSSPPAGGKFAMYVPPKLKTWAKEVMPKVASWATENPGKLVKFAGLDERLDFKRFLKQSLDLVNLAHQTNVRYPSVKQAMSELYGANLLRDILLDMRKEAQADAKPAVLEAIREETPTKTAILIGKEAAADKPKKVELHTSQTITDNLPEMTEAEREKLLRDGYLVKDRRTGEEVSVAYNTQIQMTLVNPDATDVYDVLVKVGDFARCLVIHNPHGPKGRKATAVVIKLDGDDKAWENVHPTNLFVKQQERGKSDVEEYSDWFKNLSNQKDSLAKNGVYAIVSQNGQGTFTFEVREDLGDGCWRVNWNSYGGSRADYLPDVDQSRPVPLCEEADVIYFNDREGVSFKSVNGKLFVPPDAKVIKLSGPDKCKKCGKTEEDCTCDYFHRDYSLRDKPIRPGNLADLQLQIMQKTAELKVWSDHNEVVINRKRMSKMAGLFHLISEHGLREKQAKRIMKEAERFSGARYRIKYAQPYAAMEGPGMPAPPGPEYSTMDMPYGSIAAQNGPQENYQNIPELSASNTDPAVYDPMRYMDPQAMQAAQQGQQQGQKDIFDTTMIASMLKAVREDSLVDRYLGDLVKALDRCGRILFMFYWHNDEFSNRYGKQDLPELEDSLRNAFDVLGDLVLYLKHKTVDGGGGFEEQFAM